jgi:hypothetical protein
MLASLAAAKGGLVQNPNCEQVSCNEGGIWATLQQLQGLSKIDLTGSMNIRNARFQEGRRGQFSTQGKPNSSIPPTHATRTAAVRPRSPRRYPVPNWSSLGNARPGTKRVLRAIPHFKGGPNCAWTLQPRCPGAIISLRLARTRRTCAWPNSDQRKNAGNVPAPS